MIKSGRKKFNVNCTRVETRSLVTLRSAVIKAMSKNQTAEISPVVSQSTSREIAEP